LLPQDSRQPNRERFLDASNPFPADPGLLEKRQATTPARSLHIRLGPTIQAGLSTRSANAADDVSGFTLLQQTVDEHMLGRVFGVFEVLVAAAVTAGSALATAVVERLPRWD
jgi:hypothetical protein